MGNKNNTVDPLLDTQISDNAVVTTKTTDPLLDNFHPFKGTPTAVETVGSTGVGESSYDINVPKEQTSNLEELRGQRQGRLTKLGAGLTNAITQTGLDIIKDTSYLLDFENIFDNEKSAQEGYGNWLADAMTSAEEAVKLPVYRTKESEGFSPWSAGWWGDNLPSIASTVAMAVPAQFASLGLSKIGKLVGGGKLIKNIETATGITGLADKATGVNAAILSRHMESVMEGGQTFQDTFDKSMKIEGMTEDRAKIIAGEAAANNYKANWANLITDIPQYLTINKTFSKTLQDFKFSKADLAKNIIGESAEEAYQYISNEETKRAALIKYGVEKDDKSDLTDRLTKYAQEGDFWTSAFLGGLGGGLFSAGGKMFNSKQETSQREVFDRLTALHTAVIKGDKETFNRESDTAFVNTLIKHVREDKTSNLKEAIKESIGAIEDQQERIDTQKTIRERLQVIEFAENLKTKLESDNTKSPELKDFELDHAVRQKLSATRLQEINQKLSKLQLEDALITSLVDPALYQLKLAKLELKAIEGLESLSDKTKELKKSIKSSEELLVKEGQFKTVEDINKALTTANDANISQLLYNRAVEQKQLGDIRNNLYKLSTLEGKDEFQAIVDKTKKKAEKERLKEEVKEFADTFKNKAEDQALTPEQEKFYSDNKEFVDEELAILAEQDKQTKAAESAKKDAEIKKDLKTKATQVTPETITSTPTTATIVNPFSGETGEFETSTKAESHIDNKSSEDIEEGAEEPLSYKERKTLQESIKEDIDKTSDTGEKIDDKGYAITLGDTIIPAATAFAYSSRDYEEKIVESKGKTFRILRNKDNELNLNMQEPLLLSYTNYKVGDEISLELDTAFSLTMTNKDGSEKQNITYNDLKDDVNKVPIKITNKEGKTIAYLHDLGWVNLTNVSNVKDNVAKQQELLKKIRAYITANNKVTTTIQSKFNGKLAENTKGETKTSEVFKDPNIKLAIGKKSTLYTNTDNPITGDMPINKEFKNGVTYVIAPLPSGKEIALPLFRSKLSNEVSESLTNAVEVFLTQDKAIGEKVEQATGLDILTKEGLRKYFNLFIYTNNFNQDTLDKLVGREDRVFIDIAGSGITYGRGGNLIKDVGNIGYLDKQDLINHLKDTYTSIFLSKLQNKEYKTAIISNTKEVTPKIQSYTEFVKDNTTTDLISYELPNGEYAYADQPVITFDSSFLEPKTTEEVKTDISKKDSQVKPDQPTTKSVEKPTEFGDLDLNSTELSNSDENLLPSELSEEQLKTIEKDSLLISGFTANRQSQIVSTINTFILKQLKEGDKASSKLYSEAKDIFGKYKDYATSNNREALANEFQKIIDNFDSFKELSKNKLLMFNVKETNIEGELGLEDLESNNEKNNFEDETSYGIDYKDSMSGRLKQFFSFIEDTKKNYLGLPSYVPFDEVTNYVQSQLANLEPDFAIMRSKLEDSIVSKSWLSNVVKALDATTEQNKNEFVQWASKYKDNQKTALWIKGKKTKGSKENAYTLKIIDTNRNAIINVIKEQWLENLKSTDLVKESTVNPGELIVDTTKTKELLKDLENVNKSNLEEIKNWLSKLGIEVSIETLQDIETQGKTRYGIALEKQFTDSNGIFKNITDRLTVNEQEKEGTEETLSLNNPLTDNAGINKLASVESKYTTTHYSNSHKDGEGNTVFSYTAYKYLFKQFNRLKNNTNGVVDKMRKISFNSTSSWLEQLSNPNSYFTQVFNISRFDTLRKQNSDRKGVKLKDMSPREHEISKISAFQNQANGKKTGDISQRISHFFFPTMSDKSQMMLVTALSHNTEAKIEDNDDVTLKEPTINALFKIVEGEYLRIRTYQEYKRQTKVDGYEPENFYFFKELNGVSELWNNKELRPLNPEQVTYIKNFLKTNISSIINNKINEWKELGLLEEGKLKFMDKTYLSKFIESELQAAQKTDENRVKLAAADIVVNYIIANANIYQTIIGDPAQFWKKNIEETWINIGKRLAAEIAPGLDLADSSTNNYKQVFIKDRVDTSKLIDKIEEVIGHKAAKPYREIEGTDAQEYTTLKEHLYVLEKSGKITDEDLKTIRETIESGKDLSINQLDVLLQPQKPVYVDTVIDEEENLVRKIYIKSSSFPLIPQFTKGLEIDKLRVAMEANSIDRAAYKTATKVGGPRGYADIWTKEGNIKDDLKFHPDTILTLPRSGFRLQQEVPYDPDKQEINRGTQETKLLWANILHLEGFKELYNEYNKTYGELFNLSKTELFKELEVVENPDGSLTANIEKLQAKLQAEAVGRNWPLNDVKALELEQTESGEVRFKLPLWSSTSASRIESLLISIVDNGIRKQKIHGRSFILGSEAGFNTKLIEGQSAKNFIKNNKSKIIFTKDFDPEKGLLPQDGKNPAQILITSKYKDFDVSKAITEEGYLDTTKIDPEVLKGFGFRIPTQGHNSMSYMQIVGFLPDTMGDIVIAPQDFTKQMGSDFDIDKLYSYFYNTEVIAGKLQKIASGTTSREALQNKLLDIHIEVMSNPEVQKQILEPIGFGDLQDIAKRVEKAKGLDKSNPLTDTYYKNKYINARGGSAGRGFFSLLNTFIVSAQDKNIYLRKFVKDEDGNLVEEPLHLMFGNSDNTARKENNISKVKAVDGDFKNKTSSALLSAATDDEKEQIFYRMNINPQTFHAIGAFASVGFTENFFGPLINQPIIYEYVNLLKQSQDSTNDNFIKGAKEKIVMDLFDKYTNLAGLSKDSKLVEEYTNPDALLTQKDMWEAIENKEAFQDFYKIQLQALAKFRKARDIGEKLSQIQSAINTDSSGLGISMFETFYKEEQVRSLFNHPIVANTASLIGDYEVTEDGTPTGVIKPNTVNGFASVDALFTSNKLWAKYFPYNTQGVQDIFNEILTISNRELLRTDDKIDLFEDIKSFIYSNKDLGLDNEDANALRQRFFFDSSINKSLATITEEYKKGKLKLNPFVQRLKVEKDVLGNKPSLVKYDAGAGENLDELNVYQGFAGLFRDPSTREYAQNLITSFYLSGGIQQAIQFGKYIPQAYILNSPIAKFLTELDFNNEDTLGNLVSKDNYYDVAKATKQIIQHNPNLAPKLNDDLSEIKIVDKDKFTKLPLSFTLDTAKVKHLLVPRINPQKGEVIQEAAPEFLALYDFTSPRKFKLYEYKGDLKYERIDTLGTFGMSEYHANNNEQKSLIRANQTPIIPSKKPVQLTDKRDITEVKQEIKDIPNSLPKTNLLKKYGLDKEGDKASITKFLNTIITEDDSVIANKLHKELAKQLLNLLPKTSTISFDYTKENVNGIYNEATKTISINPSLVRDPYGLERTVLHELIHHFTIPAINKPNEQQKPIVESLERLRQTLLKKIENDPVWKAEYDNFVKNLNERKGITKESLSKNYGAYNTKEFVTMALTDREFQRILNQIPFSGEKTIFQRFQDLIKSILKAIGMEVKQGSVLEKAIEDSISLLNTYTEQETTETEENFLLAEQSTPKKLSDYLKTHNTISKEDVETILKDNKVAHRYNGYLLMTIGLAPENKGWHSKESFTNTEKLNHIVKTYPGLISLKKTKYTNIITINDDYIRRHNEGQLNYLPAVTEEEVKKGHKYQPIIDTIQARISFLQKQISRNSENREIVGRYEDKIKALKQQLEDIESEERLASIITFGNSDINHINKLLEQKLLSEADLHYINSTLHTWESILPILFTDKDLIGDKGKVSANVEAIQDIKKEADRLRIIYTKAFEVAALNMLSKEGINLTAEELTKAKKEIGFLPAYLRDISTTDDILVQYIAKKIKEANFKTSTELTNTVKEIDELFDKVKKTPEFKKDGFKIFTQEHNGKSTGYLVDRKTQEYYDEFNKKLYIAKKNNNKESWEKYNSWKRNNMILFDTRLLFNDVYNELDGETKYSAKDIEAHKQELIKQLGEKGFNGYMEGLSKRIELYKEDLKQAETRIDGLDIDESEKISKLEEWKLEYSPFTYASRIYDNKTYKIGNTYIPSKGYKYSYEVPRRIDKANNPTKWYDPKFEVIENNPVLEEFYNYTIDKLNELRDYLPEYATEDLQYNYLPEIRKTVAEQFSEKGMKAGLEGWYDKFIAEISVDELQETSYAERDPLTGNIIKSLPIRMVGNKLTSEEKSYDLPKVLKAFSLMALGYKHKSEIEDNVKIAQQLVNQALEKQINAAGDQITDKNGNPIATKDGLKNFKTQFEYAINSYYGNREKVQGVSEKKILSKEDKVKIKELKEKLKDKDLTEEGKLAIEQEINSLGRNVAGSKVFKKVLSLAMYKGMAWNIFAPANNTTFSFVSNLIHASGGEDFNLPEFFRAKTRMLNSIGKSLTLDTIESKTAKKIKNLIEKFNVIGEVNQLAYQETTLNSMSIKGIKKLAPLELTRRAEYLNRGTTFLSMLEGQKIKDLTGKEQALWKAFNVDGTWNTKEFGAEPKDLVNKFKLKMDQVLKSIHGNYDPDSAVKIKENVLGQALIMFRSWVAEGFASRFEDERYDLALDRQRKGRLRTYNPITGGSVGRLTGAKLLLSQMLNFLTLGTTFKNSLNELSAVDKANMRKNAAEVLTYATLYTMILMLKGIKGDGDDKEKYALNGLINVGFRVQNDMAFFTSPIAFEKITQSSIPAMTIITDAWKFIEAAEKTIAGDPYYKSGVYRGQSRIKIAALRQFPITVQIPRTLSGITKINE